MANSKHREYIYEQIAWNEFIAKVDEHGKLTVIGKILKRDDGDFHQMLFYDPVPNKPFVVKPLQQEDTHDIKMMREWKRGKRPKN
jgi:hypothetical protein